MSDPVTRVKGDNVSLDSEKLKTFFDRRGAKVNTDSPYTSVLYQDANPEVANQRDRYEKEKIKPMLFLDKTSTVLDIGCGVGRWADSLLEQVDSYIGVDFSETLIEQAQNRISSPKAKFMVLSADHVSRETIGSEVRVNCVIISGVLLYLNDQQVVKCFHGISDILSEGALLYVREPLATEERLTLNNFWSDELDAEYCAIYRTRDQLVKLVTEGAPMFKNLEIEFKPLYADEKLNNRVETKQFYSIIKLN